LRAVAGVGAPAALRGARSRGHDRLSRALRRGSGPAARHCESGELVPRVDRWTAARRAELSLSATHRPEVSFGRITLRLLQRLLVEHQMRLLIVALLLVGCNSVALKSNGATIAGAVSKPNGNAPFPALVLLHGCGGPQPGNALWAAELNKWGYVTMEIGRASCRVRGEVRVDATEMTK